MPGDVEETFSNSNGLGLEPTDKGHRLYRLYFLLGCGTLFPYNAFITAADYFDGQYPGKHTDRLITVCYLPIMLVILSTIVCNKERFPRRPIIIGGLCGFLLSMGVIPLWSWAAAGSLPLSVVLFFVVVTGVSDGFVQSALFGEAALLPEKYTQALVSGTAASGATVAVLRIVTKAALPHTPAGLHHSAGMYFLAAALVCGGCLYVYTRVLQKIPLYQHYVTSGSLRPSSIQLLDPNVVRSTERQLPDGLSTPADGEKEKTDQPGWAHDPDVNERVDGEVDIGTNNGGALELERTAYAAPHHAAYFVVGKKLWRLSLSLILIYVITLSIFPGFLAEDVSSAWLSDWYPVILIALFNFADLAGKEMPAWGWLPEPSERAMLLGSILRVVFVPAFYFAARWGLGPAAIGSLTIVLGVSNGYLTAVTMMACPRGYQGMEAELAGNISILSLVIGLCIGAACSFFWLL